MMDNTYTLCSLRTPNHILERYTYVDVMERPGFEYNYTVFYFNSIHDAQYYIVMNLSDEDLCILTISGHVKTNNLDRNIIAHNLRTHICLWKSPL